MENETYTCKTEFVSQGGNRKYLKFEWSSEKFFKYVRNDEFEGMCTNVITVHAECVCPEYRHPKTIRLKFEKRKCDEIDLFMLCVPTVPVDIEGTYLTPPILSSVVRSVMQLGEFSLKKENCKAGLNYLATISTQTGYTGKQTITINFKIDSDLLPDLVQKNEITKTVSEIALCDDMKQLLNDDIYSDLTLLSKDDASFKVHRSILSMRSEVFKAMFQHDKSKEITTAFTKDILSQILTYIYTGRTPDVVKNELFIAADYYQLFKLRTICLAALHRQLTPDNALEMLELAEQHAAVDLLESTLHYIKNGHADLLIQTQGWKNIQSVTLLKRLFEILNKRDSQLSLQVDKPAVSST